MVEYNCIRKVFQIGKICLNDYSVMLRLRENFWIWKLYYKTVSDKQLANNGESTTMTVIIIMLKEGMKNNTLVFISKWCQIVSL